MSNLVVTLHCAGVQAGRVWLWAEQLGGELRPRPRWVETSGRGRAGQGRAHVLGDTDIGI